MDTERADDREPGEGTDPDPATCPDVDADLDADLDEDADRPSWWHRDHPVFTPLSGFFTGLVAIVLLPGIYAAALGSMFSTERADDFFPFVLLLLLVPLALVAVPRTRRFWSYLLLGMVVTAVVVAGVAALVLWVMVETGS